MKDFLSEKHGHAQKIPNPRADHEEWHLPVWMTKFFVYKLMKKQYEYHLENTGECLTDTHSYQQRGLSLSQTAIYPSWLQVRHPFQ